MSSSPSGLVASVAPIRSVAVLAGTHGNEMSGIFLHRFWKTEAGRRELHRDALRVDTVLTNELAVRRCVRYVDADLNRCYKPEYYHLTVDDDGNDDGNDDLGCDRPKLPHEAKVVARLMASLGHGKTDLALDLHNTTANAGVMLLISLCFEVEGQTLGAEDWLERNEPGMVAAHTAVYIQRRCCESKPPIPCHLVNIPAKRYNDVTRSEIFNHQGIGIEVGPQPPGVIRADIVEMQRKAVKFALDFAEGLTHKKDVGHVEDRVGNGIERRFGEETKGITIFDVKQNVDYPRDEEGNVAAMIHPNLQDGDYSPVLPGEPIFLKANGDQVIFQGDKETFPIFINEAAYYEKGVAFIHTEKICFDLPRLVVKTSHLLHQL